MGEKPRGDSVVTRFTAACIGAVTSSILFSVSMLIPPAGFLLGLLAPFPVILSRLRSGRGTAVIVLVATTALLAAVFGGQAGGLYLIQCGVTALLLPELLIRGYGAARSIAWTTAASLLVYLVAVFAIFLYNESSVQHIHDLAVSEINTNVAQALSVYERAGLKGDELAAMKKSMTAAANVIIRTYPALATVILIIMAGCNVALIKRFVVRLGIKAGIGEFRNFRNPDLMIWLLIVAGFSMLSGVAEVTFPALNILVVLGALYFLQGMAVISSMFYRLGSSAVLKVTLYLLLLVQPYVAAFIAAIGIFDLWGDFRTPRNQENL